MSENDTDREFIQNIPEGFPISSDYFNDVFDDVEEALQEFDDRLFGPWKGDWDESESYGENEVVTWNNQVFVSLGNDNKGNEPGVDSDHWDLVVSTPGNWRGDWESDTFYYVNDIVKGENDSIYIAVAQSIDENPVFDSKGDYWMVYLSSFFTWRGLWESTKYYYKDDVVKGLDGNIYISRVGNEDRDPVTDTEDYQERQYWDLYLEVGIKWRDWWEEGETYYRNDVVRANDNNLYIARSKNEDIEPTEDENDVWKLFLLGADNTDASSIQGNAFSQQDPKEDEGFRWNADTEQFDLVPLYDKQEVHSVSFQQALLFGDYSNQNSPFSTFSFDISEPEDGQTFIYNEETDMFELKQTVTSSDIKSIKIVDEEPSDPEDDVLYIISGDSIQLNGDILINSA